MKKFVRIMLSASLVLILASVVFPGLSAGAFSHTINTPQICRPPNCGGGWTHQFTLYDNPSNGGEINNEPNGWTWGPYNCNTGFNEPITADPAPGYAFSYWSGTASGTNNPSSFYVGCPAAPSVTANYVAIPNVISFFNYSSSGSYSTLSPPATINSNVNPTSVSGFSSYESCTSYSNWPFAGSVPECIWVSTGVINNTKYVQIHWEEDDLNDFSPSGFPNGNVTVDLTLIPNGVEAIPAMSVYFKLANGSAFTTPKADVFEMGYGALLYQNLQSQGSAMQDQSTHDYSSTWGYVLDEEGQAVIDLGNYLYGSSQYNGIAQVEVPDIASLSWEWTPGCDAAVGLAIYNGSVLAIELVFDPPTGIFELVFHGSVELADAYDIGSACLLYS
jgi:hypothetical protein